MCPRRRGLGLLLAAGLLLTGCGLGKGGAGDQPTPNPDQTSVSTTADPAASASPSGPTPTGVAGTPSGTASPVPGGAATPTAGGTATGVASGASCGTVQPVRVTRVQVAPRRPTEVVTIVSDGRNLTSGTRDQGDFLLPSLAGPDGTAVTDEATLSRVAGLVLTQRHRVLLSRPDPPDSAADASKKPYSAPGTYVAYNASGQLTADVTVDCSGQQQTWQFAAEGDPSTGQVNCAVEPSKSNGMAKLIYAGNC